MRGEGVCVCECWLAVCGLNLWGVHDYGFDVCVVQGDVYFATAIRHIFGLAGGVFVVADIYMGTVIAHMRNTNGGQMAEREQLWYSYTFWGDTE